MILNVPEMIEQARGLANQRAEITDQAFYTDNEILGYLRKSFVRLYNQMVKARNQWFQVTSVIDNPVYIGDGEYTLPTDFYKLNKLDYKRYDSWIELIRMNMKSENIAEEQYPGWWAFRTGRPWTYGDVYEGYFYTGSKTIKVVPKQLRSYPLRLKWVPEAPVLQMGNTTIDLPSGFEEYIIYQTAITIAVPEEGDLKNLNNEYAKIEAMVGDWMKDRSHLDPNRINKRIEFSGSPVGSVWVEANHGLDY